MHRANREGAHPATRAIILDLEDSVAPQSKEAARLQVAEASGRRVWAARVVVRINGLDTQWWLDDLNTIAHAKPDAILLPKISDRISSTTSSRLIDVGAGHAVRIWP